MSNTTGYAIAALKARVQKFEAELATAKADAYDECMARVERLRQYSEGRATHDDDEVGSILRDYAVRTLDNALGALKDLKRINLKELQK